MMLSRAVPWTLNDGFSGFLSKGMWSVSSIAFGLSVVDRHPSSSSTARGEDTSSCGFLR